MRLSLIVTAVVVLSGCGEAPASPPDDPDAGASGADAGLTLDAGGTDAGGTDAGVTDAGVTDAGGTDAGITDAGSTDAGTTDAGTTDDGGLPGSDGGAQDDAGTPDAGGDGGLLPDAGSPPDAGVPGPDFVIEGFGAATRGGWQAGGDVFLVTSLADSGPGTLREGLDTATGPRIIRFDLDGTIALTASLLVPSNVTIDGRGHAITLSGKGLILAGTDDVILINLAIVDVTPSSEDGLRIGDPTFGPSERVVVDHVTFRATGNNGDSSRTDEAMSVIFGSRDITLAWVRVENWEKVLLVGNGDASPAVDQAITVSMHHSLFDRTGRRHPQARHGIVDEWNLFLDDWHMYDWFFNAPYRESFGAQAQDGARLRVENSLFRRTTRTMDTGSQANDATRCESGGTLDGVGLVTTADSTAPLRFGAGCTGSTGWVRPYPITLDAADATLRARLAAGAGNTL